MKKMKRFLSLVLTLAMAFSVCALPAQAADVPEEPTVSPRAVVERWHISAWDCEMYYALMGSYDSWGSGADDVAQMLADATGSTPVGIAVDLAILFRQLNFNTAKRAFKKGYESGKGCTMIIYDNAVPTIIANS